MHALTAPLITDGCEGVAAVLTVRLCASDEPHALFAVTEIVPPDDDGVTVMEAVADVPDHPEGKVHVYEVAAELDTTE